MGGTQDGSDRDKRRVELGRVDSDQGRGGTSD
jgi:hypothetical protein